MKLETPDGQSFSLTVERYEFPDEELGPTAENPADDFETGRFLVVSVGFRSSLGEWEACGPEMTTTELLRLADWLDSIRIGRAVHTGVYFTERNLEFTCNATSERLLIHAHGSFLPPWSASGESITLDFAVRDIELELAVESLRKQLARFPGKPALR